jgi:hypothetical protein
MSRTACLVIAVSAAIAAAARPAAAGWDYAEWGMTPEQVVAASAGAARLATKQELKDDLARFERDRKMMGPGAPEKPFTYTRARALASFDGIGFDVKFDFLEDGKLANIRMANPSCSDGERVEKLLRTLYGTPSRTVMMARKPVRLEWVEEAHKNKVSWMNLDRMHSCYIDYIPLPPTK